MNKWLRATSFFLTNCVTGQIGFVENEAEAGRVATDRDKGGSKPLLTSEMGLEVKYL